MSKPVSIAVFASGSGSNFEALVKRAGDDPTYNVSLLVCDQPEAAVIEKARRFGIDVFSFRSKDYPNKATLESAILQKLRDQSIEWCVLAGYMRLIGPTLLRAYEGKILNIHPSLLPAFPGKDAIGQALDAKVKVTGVTVHFVDEGMDTGPVIEQVPVRIEGDRTRLQHDIQRVEHDLYPTVVKQCIKGEKAT
ncbi:phosphoribosylglycinamide formyltransferase [Pontibacillus sp. ALD_SL1]|uniref:phosphoribosylglycinamide formyltransferase n=1 Tax=Pontibacillus sp. ALD_SL1 TaxID=2777185 RepID=UPI001A962782|nr:phosphoribosylglycinamide formyltransferase [Pontibacillus sp. ALD_SL1]QST01794.1 phosphoribosylglycinamide formyltransferase [Pontibacillus sp. ALD_SL1]